MIKKIHQEMFFYKDYDTRGWNLKFDVGGFRNVFFRKFKHQNFGMKLENERKLWKL